MGIFRAIHQNFHQLLYKHLVLLLQILLRLIFLLELYSKTGVIFKKPKRIAKTAKVKRIPFYIFILLFFVFI